MDRTFSFWIVVAIAVVAYMAGAKFPMLAQRVGVVG